MPMSDPVQGFWGWVRSLTPQAKVLSVKTEYTREGNELKCHRVIEVEKSAEWIDFEMRVGDPE